MKIYFSSSLRAKKLYKKNFELIYKLIEKLGHKHTSDFLIKSDPEKFYKLGSGDFSQFYKKLTSQIKKADVCVFEVSLHSLGIGYCVNLAIEIGKPVILLYLKGENPVFFKGIKSERVQIYEYEPKQLKDVLTDALQVAKEMIDIRFTFFITPEIIRFLNFISKKNKIPRAVYIRSLLDEAIKKENFR